MCCIYLGAWNHENLPRKYNLWMLCVNGRGDESGQARLPTFGEILGKRMRELGSGSYIEIIVLDVNY